MRWKFILTLIFIVLVVGLLVVYWFIPYNTIDFGATSGNYNFNSGDNNDTTGMQFYKNMRFPESNISYRINDCNIQKLNEMEEAFEIIANSTVLEFYPVNFEEEISITCDSDVKVEGNLFIAGEGGPTNITQLENYNLILHGQILLIKNSNCQRPNIAIHELLHVLGFDHSENSNNIMYPISKCKQVIGEDTIYLINELYSVPSYPDIVFENISAVMHGKYLDVNLSMRNNGFKKSPTSQIFIYADDKFVEAVTLEQLDPGYGKIIMLTNHIILKLNIKELRFVINTDFEELNKTNNELNLKLNNSN